MTAPPVSLPAMDKIELIERSMHACFFGVPGIIPFLGIPFAIVALIHNSRIKRRIGPQWNPAHRYLFWGTVCAHIGISLTIIIAVLVTAALMLELLT
jgi:hypothetical protein